MMTDATIRGDIHGGAAAMTMNGRGCAAAPRTREKRGSLDRVLVFQRAKQSRPEQTRADQSRPGGPKCHRLSRSNEFVLGRPQRCVLSAHLLLCFQISQAPVSRMRISGRCSSFNTARVSEMCLCQHHCFEEHKLGSWNDGFFANSAILAFCLCTHITSWLLRRASS